MEGGSKGYYGRVSQVSVQSAYSHHAQGCLYGQALGLFDLEHGNGKGSHLVLADVVETQVKGEAFGRGLEDQLG